MISDAKRIRHDERLSMAVGLIENVADELRHEDPERSVDLFALAAEVTEVSGDLIAAVHHDQRGYE